MKTMPKIKICKEDYEALSNLLDSLPESQENNRLINELERAKLVDSDKLPRNVVRMHSIVTFTAIQTNKTFTLKLVYPNEPKVSGTLSVLTPAGSALLGLSEGQEIEWPIDGNKFTRIFINSVDYQ